MTILHIDIETYSEEDLKESGVYRYAEHPSTQINCLGYAIDDGPVHLWIPFDDVPRAVLDAVQARHPTVVLEPGTRASGELLAAWEGDPEHQQGSMEKRAHNAQFERVVLNGTAGQKLGLPKSTIPEWTCTAAKVAAMGLPRSLDDASKALNTHRKSDAGRMEMMQLAKPKKPSKADPTTRYTLQSAPEKWIAMLCYNIDDVLAEREIDDAIPDLDPNEQRLYHLDQKINERGWACDIESVHNILAVVEEYKEQLAAECVKLTTDWMTGEGLQPTQREKISNWVRAAGFGRLPDMTAETIKWALKQTDCPDHVKTVLKIYSTYNAKSVSKLQAMLRAVCADGRLRGMFLFYGAATGRWSSLIVQLQNILRPLIKDPNTAIAAFADRMLGTIRFLWPEVDPMKVAGSCVRGLLIASPGMDLVFPDYSGIEDRVNLWFFDEEQMLDVYRAYDRIIPGKLDKKGEPLREGRHPYSITICNMFGLDLDTFDDEDPRRQIGKAVRLAMGYEGGVSAYATMAENLGVDLEAMATVVLPQLPEDALDHAKWMRENHPTNAEISRDVETACNGLKYLYRKNSPGVVQGWKHLKEAAEKAVEFEGQTFWLPNKKLAFRVELYKGRKWLSMRLPSGRKIRYFDPKWTPPRESERYINNELVPYTIPGFMDYMGIDTYTRQWMRLQTYGGKLDENADQGFSRDIMANAMLAIDAAGYGIVGSEHDKPIVEIESSCRLTAVPHIRRLMLEQPSYCEGLPLACDGKAVKRYGK